MKMTVITITFSIVAVTKRYFDGDAECYDWFHDNYGEEEYIYEKLG